jgi:hypothetical protein
MYALAKIVSAWPGIVGADVGRAAHPGNLIGDALLIHTESADWSHQLAFLERDILAGVHAAGAPWVKRLRFRVGAHATGVSHVSQ